MNTALALAMAAQSVAIFILSRRLYTATVAAGQYRGALLWISRSGGGGRKQVAGLGSMQTANTYTLRGHADAIKVADDVLDEVAP